MVASSACNEEPVLETSISLLDRLASQPSEGDWRRMVDLYQPLLRSWCLRSGVPETDADDLMQETLTVVVREVAGFDRRHPGAFRGWLRRLIRRSALWPTGRTPLPVAAQRRQPDNRFQRG